MFFFATILDSPTRRRPEPKHRSIVPLSPPSATNSHPERYVDRAVAYKYTTDKPFISSRRTSHRDRDLKNHHLPDGIYSYVWSIFRVLSHSAIAGVIGNFTRHAYVRVCTSGRSAGWDNKENSECVADSVFFPRHIIWADLGPVPYYNTRVRWKITFSHHGSIG